jgi:hypothetical protein
VLTTQLSEELPCSNLSVEDLLKTSGDQFKKILYVLCSVDSSDIGDVNANKRVATKLSDYLYSELSDVDVRNTQYATLNSLLVANYALAMSIKATYEKSTIPYAFKDISDFIEVYLENETSLTTPLQSLLQDKLNVDRWNTYLGYNSSSLQLYDEYDPQIDTMFSITYRKVLEAIDGYGVIYANALSESKIESSSSRSLFKYEAGLSKLLSKAGFTYTVGDDSSKNVVVNYLHYYLGFDVIGYNKKGNIEFNYSSGAINPEIATHLLDVESKMSNKSTLISLMKDHYAYLFEDKNNLGETMFDRIINDLLGTNADVPNLLKATNPDVITNLGSSSSSVFKLHTLNSAILVLQSIENGSFEIDVSRSKEAAKTRVISIIDMCLEELSDKVFIKAFGEYQLIT